MNSRDERTSTTSREFWLGCDDDSSHNLQPFVDFLVRPGSVTVRRTDSYVIPDNETALRTTRFEFERDAPVDVGPEDDGRQLVPLGFFRTNIPLRDTRTELLAPSSGFLVRLSKSETEALAIACLDSLWMALAPLEKQWLRDKGFMRPWDPRLGIDPWWLFLVGNESRLRRDRQVSATVTDFLAKKEPRISETNELSLAIDETNELSLAIRRQIFRQMKDQYQAGIRGEVITGDFAKHICEEVGIDEDLLKELVNAQRSEADGVPIPDFADIWHDPSDLNPGLQSWTKPRADLAKLCSRIAHGYIAAVWLPSDLQALDLDNNTAVEITYEEEIRDERERIERIKGSTKLVATGDHLPAIRILEPVLSRDDGPLTRRSEGAGRRFKRFIKQFKSGIPGQYGRVLIPSWSLGDSVGFSVEIEAPPGTYIDAASRLRWPNRLWRSSENDSESGVSRKWEISVAEGYGRKLHLRLRRSEIKDQDKPIDSRPSLVELAIRANAEDSVRFAGIGGLLLTAFCSLLLLVAGWQVQTTTQSDLDPSWLVHQAPDLIPTILTLVPGAVITYILVQGEHGIVSRLLNRLRLKLIALLLLSGAFGFIAAILSFPSSPNSVDSKGKPKLGVAETAFGIDEWIPLALAFLGLFFGVIGAWLFYPRKQPLRIGELADLDRHYSSGRVFTATVNGMESPRIWTRPGRRTLLVKIKEYEPQEQDRAERFTRADVAIETLSQRVARTPTVNLPIVPHELEVMGDKYAPVDLDYDLVCDKCLELLTNTENTEEPVSVTKFEPEQESRKQDSLDAINCVICKVTRHQSKEGIRWWDAIRNSPDSEESPRTSPSADESTPDATIE